MTWGQMKERLRDVPDETPVCDDDGYEIRDAWLNDGKFIDERDVCDEGKHLIVGFCSEPGDES